ncbi:MAG: DUF1343 domain-containing protein [Kiritimatiellae bacterium]|nr:DUF1343 domain-containing protein [Kiritimatiellia bacterium]
MQPFLNGMDVLLTRHAAWLTGRRVALLSHQAALTMGGATSAQRLRAVLGKRLVALFGPEHGFMGLAGAGALTLSRRHPDWGIPVHSLYGTHRQPDPAMLRGIDTIVCDLQDLGARCYTYLATLRHMLQAAAAQGIAVIVADRPVPLPGVYDGPVAETSHLSFVAPVTLPLCTGLTPGEAARWIAREERLALDLRVVPVRGWDRKGPRGAGWTDWVPPSPGIRTWESGMTYLSTVFTEALPGIDCGRGTNMAFRVVGAPWLRGVELCEALRRRRLPGVSFHPFRYAAAVLPFAGRELDGVRLSVNAPLRFRPVLTAVTLLHTLQTVCGAGRVWRHRGVRPGWFDQLFGTARTRQQLQSGLTPDAIAATWVPALRRHAAACRELRLY